MRCFQCGNSLPINDKARQEKYPHYSMAQLHAHYYPTCEWVKEILGVKYIAQVLHDRYKASEKEAPLYESELCVFLFSGTFASGSSVLRSSSIDDIIRNNHK